MKNGSYSFDVMMKENMLDDVVLNMGGMHNVENAVAAISIASSLGIANDKIKKSVESFRGVKRRFEYVVKNQRVVYIDDYAHHPEELRALINSARALFHEKKCTVIFQPHLYTRTRDLAPGFSEVLNLADNLILLPIYPARELPIQGVTSEMILDKMNHSNGKVLTKDEVLKYIEKDFSKNLDKEFGEVLITAGAGDIDLLVNPIKQMLEKI
jgi:UDP-N-acetylmuramate--alanine ligase